MGGLLPGLGRMNGWKSKRWATEVRLKQRQVDSSEIGFRLEKWKLGPSSVVRVLEEAELSFMGVKGRNPGGTHLDSVSSDDATVLSTAPPDAILVAQLSRKSPTKA